MISWCYVFNSVLFKSSQSKIFVLNLFPSLHYGRNKAFRHCTSSTLKIPRTEEFSNIIIWKGYWEFQISGSLGTQALHSPRVKWQFEVSLTAVRPRNLFYVGNSSKNGICQANLQFLANSQPALCLFLFISYGNYFMFMVCTVCSFVC